MTSGQDRVGGHAGERRAETYERTAKYKILQLKKRRLVIVID
jgi:hypothetical protein